MFGARIDRFRLAWAAVVVLAVGSVAAAAPVYHTPVGPSHLTGSRSVNNGLTTTNSNWVQHNATVAWSITDNLDGTFTYTYTFAGFRQPSISHITLDLTEDAIEGDELADPLAITNPQIDDDGPSGPHGFTAIASSDVEYGNKDGITGAVKFDVGTEESSVSYRFTSNRAPVWGHLFVKGGSGGLNNTGLSNPNSSDILDFIARPNGVIPEPASLILLGLAAAALLPSRR